MANRFHHWLACPDCGVRGTASSVDEGVGVLAHGADLVLECYACGTTAEFTLGEDVPFNGLDPEAVSEESASADGDGG